MTLARGQSSHNRGKRGTEIGRMLKKMRGETTMSCFKFTAISSAIALTAGMAFAQDATIPIQNYSQVAGVWHGTTKHGTRVVLQVDANGQCYSGTNQGTGKMR